MSIAAKGCVHSKRWQSIELRDQRLICENWIWLACQASPLGNLGFVSNLFQCASETAEAQCISHHRPPYLVHSAHGLQSAVPAQTWLNRRLWRPEWRLWPKKNWAFMAITLRSPESPWYKIALEAPLHRLVGIHTLASKLSLHKQRCNVFRRLRGGMFDGPQSIPPHCQKHQKPPDVFTKIVSSHELLMLPSSQLSRSTSATEPCTCSDNR